MRIKWIRLAWFRGAADPVTLDADCKSMVVYGQNAAGKSSFVDAVEYVIHDGKIEHLTHEYSGRNQEKAVPNTHTPAGRSTELWMKFEGDAELNVKIAADGTHTKSGAEGIAMSTWEYRRTVLRQDEVAAFIRSSKGAKYSALLPLLGLHELEIAAENLRQLARIIQQRSKLDHKHGALSQMGIKRKPAFGDDSDDTIEKKIAALHKGYCPTSITTDPPSRCKELEAAIATRIELLSAENLKYLALRTIAAINFPAALNAVRNANAKLAGSIEPLISEKLAVLEAGVAFAGKLPETGDIACPACGQLIPAVAFKSHVDAEQRRLQAIILTFGERKSAISALIDILKTSQSTLAKGELKDWRDALRQGSLATNIHWLEQCNPESLRQSLSENDLKAIEDKCLAIIKAADNASQKAPPNIKDLAKDKSSAEAAKAVFEAKILAQEIQRAEALLAFINSVEAGVRAEIRQRAGTVITEISGDIRSMWKALHPGEPIEEVRLYLPEDDKAIDIALKFHGKDQDSPRLTLSEGYRNCLGLCIFLALAKREAGKDRPLILDDVVVSFDRNHRGMVAQLLSDEFAQRQVIVLTHDRDWYAELRQQLDETNWRFKILLPYETPVLGIRWSHKTTTFDDARAQIRDRPDSACNDARKIMDTELSLIAEKLELRLPYVRGDKNDKRMAHDFLKCLAGEGKKCLQRRTGSDFACDTTALDQLDKADRLLVSWANKGSHSFDIAPAEASALIDACETALAAFKCTPCGKPLWFTDAAGPEWVQCQCGDLRWRYGKG